MINNPQYAHKILRIITDVRKEWISQRAKFLGKGVGKGNLYNDEVNCPTLSPKLYEEFALPYELELSDFHDGILYFHSCGDTTKLLPSISKIETLEMFHVGPWTDVTRAMETFKGKVPLEICLHPLRDVQKATEIEMENRLNDIASSCDGSPYTVRADGLQVIGNIETDLLKIKKWISLANSILSDDKYLDS